MWTGNKANINGREYQLDLGSKCISLTSLVVHSDCTPFSGGPETATFSRSMTGTGEFSRQFEVIGDRKSATSRLEVNIHSLDQADIPSDYRQLIEKNCGVSFEEYEIDPSWPGKLFCSRLLLDEEAYGTKKFSYEWLVDIFLPPEPIDFILSEIALATVDVCIEFPRWTDRLCSEDLIAPFDDDRISPVWFWVSSISSDRTFL